MLMAAYASIKTPPLRHVEIETTTLCTRKCGYCPNSFMTRPPGLMAEETFYKVIDDLKSMGFKGRLSPHFYGEPLSDARLEKFIRYTKKSLPQCTVKLFTNGDLLTFERFESLRDSGVDIVRISNHDRILNETVSRLKARYPQMIEVIDYYSDYISSKTLIFNRGGLLDTGKKMSRTCHFVNFVTIDYRGNMVLCCNDYTSSVVLGNVHKETVKTIWNRHSFRRACIMNGLWLYPICKKC